MSPHVTPTYSFSGFLISDSQQVGFYRSFGRPIAKVFLGAMFTYQMTYLLWLKLETEETKADQNGTYRLPSLNFGRALTLPSAIGTSTTKIADPCSQETT